MHGDRLPRHALRHRDAAGLPAGRRAARGAARRPRAGVPATGSVNSSAIDGLRRFGVTQTADAEATAGELTPLADYLGCALRRLRALPPLDLDLTQAYGNVLAEDVVAPHPFPSFDQSAIDGYAARSEDIAAAGRGAPLRLNVIGDLSASSWRPVRLSPGTCFSVAAGSTLPAGADVVVPVEWTDQGMAAVEIFQAPKRGSGVRRAGDELAAGAILAPHGCHRDTGARGRVRRHRHRARGRAAQPAGGHHGHRRRAGRGRPGQPTGAGRRRQLARARRRGRRGGRAGVPRRHLRRRPGGPARAPGGPDPAGRPHHHHRRYGHRPGRHGAAGAVARRRQPQRAGAVRGGRRLPGHHARLRDGRLRRGADREPAGGAVRGPHRLRSAGAAGDPAPRRRRSRFPAQRPGASAGDRVVTVGPARVPPGPRGGAARRGVHGAAAARWPVHPLGVDGGQRPGGVG